MQTEDPVPSDAHLPCDQDAFLSEPTDAEAWQAPPRRRKSHRQNVASLDENDCTLLNSVITSVAQAGSEFANTVSHQVVELQHVVRRVGLVCPRHPGRHRVVARAVTHATDTRCLRRNTLPALGEVWAGCSPCDFLFCWQRVANYTGGGDHGHARSSCLIRRVGPQCGSFLRF